MSCPTDFFLNDQIECDGRTIEHETINACDVLKPYCV